MYQWYKFVFQSRGATYFSFGLRSLRSSESLSIYIDLPEVRCINVLYSLQNVFKQSKLSKIQFDSWPDHLQMENQIFYRTNCNSNLRMISGAKYEIFTLPLDTFLHVWLVCSHGPHAIQDLCSEKRMKTCITIFYEWPWQMGAAGLSRFHLIKGILSETTLNNRSTFLRIASH